MGPGAPGVMGFAGTRTWRLHSQCLHGMPDSCRLESGPRASATPTYVSQVLSAMKSTVADFYGRKFRNWCGNRMSWTIA